MVEHSKASDIAAALAAARLRAIRTALLVLHKAVIDTERGRYARAHGPVETPHQLLQLVLRDPWFAWLRPIAELIVQADERLDADQPITTDQAEAYAAQTLGVLQRELGGADFRREYQRSLQETPEIVVAHAAVVRLAVPEK
jgi:hypothetical protein